MIHTKIQWADATWSPWRGCTKVSPGCANCYAEANRKRVGEDCWGDGKPRILTKNWETPHQWNSKAEKTGKRIPELLKIPASRHGICCEPLLGHVDLMLQNDGGIDWVIVGGESGWNARPCHIEWVRRIVIQCINSGTPCFVKQLGTHPYFYNANAGPMHFPIEHPKGADLSEWPVYLRVQQMPKGLA